MMESAPHRRKQGIPRRIAPPALPPPPPPPPDAAAAAPEQPLTTAPLQSLDGTQPLLTPKAEEGAEGTKQEASPGDALPTALERSDSQAEAASAPTAAAAAPAAAAPEAVPDTIKPIFLASGLYAIEHKVDKKKAAAAAAAAAAGEGAEESAMPLPRYHGMYVLNTPRDFFLPHEIHHAFINDLLAPPAGEEKQEGFRKRVRNVYVDVPRPPVLKDVPVCSCVPPEDDSPGCTEHCLNRMMFIECREDTCPCGDACTNNRFQKRLWLPSLRRAATPRKGFGIFAKEAIPSGTFVLEYVGEVMTTEAYKDRARTIYDGKDHYHCLNLDGGLVVDAGLCGSEARFINHSCDPNCEIEKWNVLGEWRVGIFTRKNIAPGEELTYDYNFESFAAAKVCLCGAKNCRGVISKKSDKSAAVLAAAAAAEAAKSKKKKSKKKSSSSEEAGEAGESVVKKEEEPVDQGPITESDKEFLRKRRVLLPRNVRKFILAELPPAPPAANTEDEDPEVAAAWMQQQRQEAREREKERERAEAELAAFQTKLKDLQRESQGVVRSVRTRTLAAVDDDLKVELRARLALLYLGLWTRVVEHKNVKGIKLSQPFMKLPSRTKYKEYYDIIAQPMDLSTVEEKIHGGVYQSPDEFNADMLLVFDNALRFNMPKSDIYKHAQQLKSLYTAHYRTVHKAEIIPLLEMSLQKKRREREQMSSNDGDLIRCVCERWVDEGEMVQCEKCQGWQHSECMHVTSSALPEPYHCHLCRPASSLPREIPVALTDLSSDCVIQRRAAYDALQPEVVRTAAVHAEAEAQATQAEARLGELTAALARALDVKRHARGQDPDNPVVALTSRVKDARKKADAALARMRGLDADFLALSNRLWQIAREKDSNGSIGGSGTEETSSEASLRSAFDACAAMRLVQQAEHVAAADLVRELTEDRDRTERDLEASIAALKADVAGAKTQLEVSKKQLAEAESARDAAIINRNVAGRISFKTLEIAGQLYKPGDCIYVPDVPEGLEGEEGGESGEGGSAAPKRKRAKAATTSKQKRTEMRIGRILEVWRDVHGRGEALVNLYARPHEVIQLANTMFYPNEVVLTADCIKVALQLTKAPPTKCLVLFPDVFTKGRPIGMEKADAYICCRKSLDGRGKDPLPVMKAPTTYGSPHFTPTHPCVFIEFDTPLQIEQTYCVFRDESKKPKALKRKQGDDDDTSGCAPAAPEKKTSKSGEAHHQQQQKQPAASASDKKRKKGKDEDMTDTDAVRKKGKGGKESRESLVASATAAAAAAASAAAVVASNETKKEIKKIKKRAPVNTVVAGLMHRVVENIKATRQKRWSNVYDVQDVSYLLRT